MNSIKSKPNTTLNLLKKDLNTIDKEEHHNYDVNNRSDYFKRSFGQSPQQNIKNKKEFDNEFIHFKKRKPYTYNSYEHFSNPRKTNKYKYNIYDDLYKPLNKNSTKIEFINKSYKKVDNKNINDENDDNDDNENNDNENDDNDDNENDDDNCSYINNSVEICDNKDIQINSCYKNIFYENIRESKNYPELNIDLNKLNSEYVFSLKSQNIKINIPITSYGIVLYTYEKDKYLKYLVCQRRDSISYIQYLQDLIEEKNILKYINLMSKEEKKRCLEYYYKNDSHSIWKDLWLNNKSKIYINNYNRCTKMFQKNMEKYIEYFKDESSGQNENQWFFPKGRIHKNENEIHCALREFEEETNISSKNISVNKNMTFEEYYVGSNNLIYKSVYYTAYIPYIPKKIYKYFPSNIRTKFISSEIYDMEWLEFKDVFQKLDETKKDVITKINNYILKKKKF